MRIFHGKCGNRNADFPVGKDGGKLSLEDQQRLFGSYSERIEAYLDAGDSQLGAVEEIYFAWHLPETGYRLEF